MKTEVVMAGQQNDVINLKVKLDDVPTGGVDILVGLPRSLQAGELRGYVTSDKPEYVFSIDMSAHADGTYPIDISLIERGGAQQVLRHELVRDKAGGGQAPYRIVPSNRRRPFARRPLPIPPAPAPAATAGGTADVVFEPPMPLQGDDFDAVVEFDPYPDVIDYKVEIVLPGGFAPAAAVLLSWDAQTRSGRPSARFNCNTGNAKAGRYPVAVAVTPLAAKGGAASSVRGPITAQVGFYVIDRATPFYANALKENFDDVVGGKLAGAVESIASQLRLQHTAGIRLARAADPFAASPARTQFWAAIRASTSALSYANYHDFMTNYFCGGFRTPGTMAMPFSQVDSYLRLKAFTELFMLINAGVLSAPPAGNGLSALQANDVPYRPFNNLTLPAAAVRQQIIAARPYLQIVLQDNDVLNGAAALDDICDRLRYPVLIELIWSYWHEESMMVQTLRAIRDRFQNRARGTGPDPLAQLEMDPLRPLNNIFWGYVQDEQHRLGVRQRAYEYLHQYGIGLEGRAVGTLRPADTRKQFLQSFHTLLYQCVQYYKQADDTTVVANANNVLWALKDLHLLLAEGAHNQFGDLPWNARLEMLMEQWILARPELQDFLRARRMVPYPEGWMGAVDSMKTLQGWNSTNVIHFRDLGVFGEQILLSVREGGVGGGQPTSGSWSVINDPMEAAAFAITWRPEIEGYINAYRAVTGVDVTQDPTDARFMAERDTAPSVHLKRRAGGAR